MRRVVVTGIGAISALGRDRHAFWDALSHGRSGIRPMQLVDRTQLRFQNGAEVPDYNPAEFFDEKDIGLLDRFAQFGVIAAREAVKDADIEWTAELRERSAIVTGSCVGGQSTEDEGFVGLYKNGTNRVNPFTIPRTMGNAAASRISLEYGVVGPTYTVSTACSSANHAIGQAMWMIRSGGADLAITGGSEAVFSLGFLKAWEAMRVVSPDTCRPFSKDRRGLILGEGAGMLVLEHLEAAHTRQHHVEQDHADGSRGIGVAVQNAERLRAVARLDDLVPLVAQHVGEQLTHGRLVFHDEHSVASGHDARSPAVARWADGIAAPGGRGSAWLRRRAGAPARHADASSTLRKTCCK